MLMNLDYPQLAALAAVVREGSFEAAARALHVTPSAVSQRIRALEERVGAVLVQRGQPCVSTAAGRPLLLHAQRVALLEAELHAVLPAARGARPTLPTATLHVAVNADSLATWFVAALAAFAPAHPSLRVELVVDDQDHTAQALREGAVLAAAAHRRRRSRAAAACRSGACATPRRRVRPSSNAGSRAAWTRPRSRARRACCSTARTNCSGVGCAA
jgi:LysR family transcriptional regulator, chromosome initiation inhibitor